MAYNELIKNFEKVRGYMRQFYIFGFKSRNEYDSQSTRSYDNERRRLESWLGDYMSFRQSSGEKNVFISVDSRAIPGNPLYNAFKAKSFTPGDILFHFVILDILHDDRKCTVHEIIEEIANQYLSHFEHAEAPDESTIRKKLKEYAALGLLSVEKRGRELLYSRNTDPVDPETWTDAISFFSEADPLGVIGSTLLDKLPPQNHYFNFKHHYILHALDSQILYDLLQAIDEGRCAELSVISQHSNGKTRLHTVFPVKIYISTQSGRQYLLCYHYRFRQPMFFRLDGIHAVKAGAVEKRPQKYSGWYDKFRENLWDVSTGIEFSVDHIEMTLHIDDGEGFILQRLEREKRGGRIEVIDDHTYRFIADVYDAGEMLPWLRTFIGRIVNLECSNPTVTKTFYQDLDKLNEIYGGDDDAVS